MKPKYDQATHDYHKFMGGAVKEPKHYDNKGFVHYFLLGLLEPVVFVASLMISVVIVLHGIGSDYSQIFGFFRIANEKIAMSDGIAIFIPVSTIAVLTVLISFTRKNASSVVPRLKTPYQFTQIIVCILLLGCLVLSVLEFGQAFRAGASLPDSHLANIRILLLSTLFLSLLSLTLCKLDESLFEYFFLGLEQRTPNSVGGEEDG